MTERGVGCAVVISQSQEIAGIITERDILQAVASEHSMDDTKVEDVMTREVVTGSPGWSVVQAVKTMVDGGFRHLLITEMDETVGIVSLRDLMDSMATMVQEEAST